MNLALQQVAGGIAGAWGAGGALPQAVRPLALHDDLILLGPAQDCLARIRDVEAELQPIGLSLAHDKSMLLLHANAPDPVIPQGVVCSVTRNFARVLGSPIGDHQQAGCKAYCDVQAVNSSAMFQMLCNPAMRAAAAELPLPHNTAGGGP